MFLVPYQNFRRGPRGVKEERNMEKKVSREGSDIVRSRSWKDDSGHIQIVSWKSDLQTGSIVRRLLCYSGRGALD